MLHVFLPASCLRLERDGSFSLVSACRFVPEVVSPGPAGGQLVPQFPISREDNEVVQLYAGQQPTPAPHVHARYVVRRTDTAHDFLSCTQRTLTE